MPRLLGDSSLKCFPLKQHLCKYEVRNVLDLTVPRSALPLRLCNVSQEHGQLLDHSQTLQAYWVTQGTSIRFLLLWVFAVNRRWQFELCLTAPILNSRTARTAFWLWGCGCIIYLGLRSLAYCEVSVRCSASGRTLPFRTRAAERKSTFKETEAFFFRLVPVQVNAHLGLTEGNSGYMGIPSMLTERLQSKLFLRSWSSLHDMLVQFNCLLFFVHSSVLYYSVTLEHLLSNTLTFTLIYHWAS